MSSSGLIYVAIVGAWAAYLVPRCLRRSDDQLSRRSADRFSGASRVLARRDRRDRRPDEAHYSLLRLRPASRPAPVVKARRVPGPTLSYRPAYGPAYRDRPSAPQPRIRGVSAATMARRRRVLGLLVSAAAVAVPAAIVGWMPVWGAAPPVLLLVMYVAELRAQERRRRVVGLRRRRGQLIAEVRRRRTDVAMRLEAVRRALRPAAPQEPPATEPTVEVHDGWQPVSVPLPTYVTAPKAPIRVRTIDVSSEGAWTSSGTLVAETDAEPDGRPIDQASGDDSAEIPVVGSVAGAAETASEEGQDSIDRLAVND